MHTKTLAEGRIPGLAFGHPSEPGTNIAIVTAPLRKLRIAIAVLHQECDLEVKGRNEDILADLREKQPTRGGPREAKGDRNVTRPTE